MNQTSIYFHIPFCTKKCPYCHFFVLPDKNPLKERYLKALRLEWEKQSHLLTGKKIESIYFGGGTPTLIGPDAIAEILSWIPHDPSIEITLEANPEEITPPLIQAFRSAGVNRLSIGVQSLNDNELKTLGRLHSAQKALDALNISAKAGFSNITIDLMYELPGQTLSSWEKTLSHLSDLPITHLSLYNLTIEPGTAFFKQRQKLTKELPPSETALAMLNSATQKLDEIGLKRYEISAFAKEGCKSIHNTGYWTARPFLGFGPSAFSHWEGRRFRNFSNLSLYARALEKNEPWIDFEERLPYPKNLHELLAVELRLLKGVDLLAFEKRHGQLPLKTHDILKELQKEDYLKLTSTLHLTEKGLLFYDSVATAII